jgi:hypothetical protein
MMLSLRKERLASARRGPANDNYSTRHVVVELDARAPITITEVEVFDYLIGANLALAANDNERPDHNPAAIRDSPPLYRLPKVKLSNSKGGQYGTEW